MGRVYDFLSNSSDGVFVVDDRQRIALWNDAAEDCLGYSAAKTVGATCHALLAGRDDRGCAVCRRMCEPLLDATASRLPPNRDVEVRTVSGRDMWINLSLIVVPGQAGSIEALIHVFRPIDRQHELTRIVGEFAGLVSQVAGEPSPPSRGPGSTAGHDLTDRERQILDQLKAGRPTKVIADRLCISSRTVRNHIANILAKLGVHSRLEAVTWSIRNGVG